MFDRLKPLLILLTLGFAPPGFAEGTSIAFGGLKGDTTLPVEVKADSLSVDQTSGQAIFAGGVLVTQGEMRLSAESVRVEYATDSQKIAKLYATGKVILVNVKDAAEASEAVYTIDSGEVVMTGDVLLTQGQAAIKGQRLVIDLKTGTGRMEGGVTTTFIPGKN